MWLGLFNTVEDLWDIVVCAVSGADRAAANAGCRGSGDKGASADVLAVMNGAAAAAAAAASDRQRGEEGGENSGGSDRDDRDTNGGNSNSRICLPQGHILMSQGVVADEDCQDLEPEGDQSRFLWFSADTVGPEDCDLRNGE